MLLEKRVAVVTGGGRGIGRATALKLAEEGASVVIAARTASELEETAAAIEARGSRVLSVTMDLAVQGQIESLFHQALDRFGQIDVLVNNAARTSPLAPLVDLELEEWDTTFDVNLRAVMLSCKLALPSMIERRTGSIINIGSTNGRRGIPGRIAYGASKWGLIGFTQVLAGEVGQHNVRVNCVVPGATRTEALEESMRNRARVEGITYEDAMRRAAFIAPLNRVVEPEETAEVILFLASDKSSGVHGQSINVNAGMWMN